MNHNTKYGEFGERIAIKYLLRKNYKIISQNTRLGKQEIDIIANISDKIIFIEVKTRLSTAYEQAEFHFTPKKLNNIKKAITIYSLKNNVSEERIQINFVAIQLNIDKKIANIKHFLSIF